MKAYISVWACFIGNRSEGPAVHSDVLAHSGIMDQTFVTHCAEFFSGDRTEGTKS